MSDFANRTDELAALERWWSEQSRLALVWGRRRVGKTALLQHFVHQKRVVFHTGAGRGEAGELALLSARVTDSVPGGLRDLAHRPYVDWDDAFDDLATRSGDAATLLVLDEFPELVESSPALPGILRAFLDRGGARSGLRILLCGSAARQMQALQEAREPLYGRFDLALMLHPFEPHEAALMLERLSPADQARVYGIVGGMPLYLNWWDQRATVDANLERLVCRPAARLLTEGDLVLRTEIDAGEYAGRALHAIAEGRTRYGQIKDYIRAEPQRTLERLVDLRLVERLEPIGSPDSSKRRRYRIADPFLAFYLGVVTRYRTEIERGLGPSILPVLREALDDHMGHVWEELFRRHLRRVAAGGRLPVKGHVVGVGAWWDASSQHEIDAVVLAGRAARPVMVGEAKWGARVDASRLVTALRRKVEQGLRLDPGDVAYAVCSRERPQRVPAGVLAITAADVFGA